MTRHVAIACAWLGLAIPAAAQAPEVRPPVQDARSFERAMQDAGADWAIVANAVASPSYLMNSVRGDALGRVEVMRASFAEAGTWLARRGQDDAADRMRRLLARLGAMRATLAQATPDQAEAQEIADAVSEACRACHETYREGDAAAGYRPRAGLLD